MKIVRFLDSGGQQKSEIFDRATAVALTGMLVNQAGWWLWNGKHRGPIQRLIGRNWLTG